MGIFDSSIYRVRPLMQLVENDREAFLKLLTLVGIPSMGEADTICYNKRDNDKNCGEKQLKPTKRHLAKLIKYVASKDYTGVTIKNPKRRELCLWGCNREAACNEALALLEENYDKLQSNGHEWYVFEGFTSPDIFIEGEDYVIVGEGKWTEPHITTKTTHLSAEGEYRNQMVRHIQGALNYTNKKVYAFYIVDDNCGYKEDLSVDSFKAQVENETIKMLEPEKSAVINAYCGYTTWDDVKNTFPNVIFKSKEQILKQ